MEGKEGRKKGKKRRESGEINGRTGAKYVSILTRKGRLTRNYSQETQQHIN